MCGITGFFSKSAIPALQTKLQEAIQSQIHRGPDALGYFLSEDGKVGLGHNRLSIIDLSTRSNQPFYSLDERYVMVYNGEVYNFIEIKEKLKLTTRTSSDTEVILLAFILLGPEFVHHLKGMFTIAIYDKVQKKLFLFRDRVGVKPLYIYEQEDNIYFASELKGIFCFLGRITSSIIDKEAISNFLYLGYIPSFQSIIKGVKKFPAGNFAEISNGSVKPVTYWNLTEQLQHSTIKNEKEAMKLVSENIEAAVRRRLVSDVPLGVFLSGGVDSSLITAYANKNLVKPVQTFSIGFKEEEFNEAAFARKVADQLKADHHELILTYDDAKKLVEQLIETFDEPFADSSAIPTMLVSRFAKNHVKVALSGDGGDELFLGYGMYLWAQRLNNPLLSGMRKPLAAIMNAIGGNRIKRAAMVLNYPGKSTLKSHILSQEQYLFSNNELLKLLKFPVPKVFDEVISSSKRVIDAMEQQAIFDMKHYLNDDLLVKVDRASMKYGLEVREPLLDHELISCALNVDSSLKIKGGEQKYILKKILTGFLPDELVYRKKKGFSIPLNRWLKRDLRILIEKYLSKEIVEGYGICCFTQIEKIKTNYFNGQDFLYNRVWALLILHMWLYKNIND